MWELKDKLGHFSGAGEKARYMRKTSEMMDEITRQLLVVLAVSQEPQQVINALENSYFTAFFDDVLDRLDKIRYVKGYIAKRLRICLY